MSLSLCHDILTECATAERLAHDEYLLYDDIEVLDLRLELLHDYMLLHLRAVYPLPAVDFILVLSGVVLCHPPCLRCDAV